MRGKDINLTVLAGERAEREVRFVKESGEDWGLENVAVSGVIWDVGMTEELGEIECKVTEDGRLEIGFPAMELGRYVFAIDGQADDGERERLIEGYIGYEEPRVLEAGNYEEEMVVMVRGDVRKVLFGRNTAWEGLYEETNKAKDEAQEAAEGAELAKNEALEALKGAQEFIGSFNEAVSNVIYIGSNGNWWIGGEDTGRPSQGKNGITPHIGADGYWYVGDTCLERKASGENGLTPYIGANGHWCIGGIDTGVLARGRDGLDGTAVRRILVDSYEDIPWSGETCNGGFYYYVYMPYIKATAATGWFEWTEEAYPNWTVWSLKIAGVEIIYSGYDDSVTWVEAVNNKTAQTGVRALPNDGAPTSRVYLVAEEAGTAGNSITLSVPYDNTPILFSGATLTGGTDEAQGEHYDVYAWLEPDGWVCVGEANDIATQEVFGLVKLGTDNVAATGAPVAVNGSHEMTVPQASTAVHGSGKLSTADPLNEDTDGAIGVSESGQLLAQHATAERFGTIRPSRPDTLAQICSIGVIPPNTIVDGTDRGGLLGSTPALKDTYGQVKCAYQFTTFNGIQYLAPLGVRMDATEGAENTNSNFYWGANGQAGIPLHNGGALRWISTSSETRDDKSYSTGGYMQMVHSNQFSVTEAAGLTLESASTVRLAGVYLATSLGDSRGSAVPNAAMVLAGDNGVVEWVNETFRTIADSYSSSDVDALLAALEANVYTKAEVDEKIAEASSNAYTKTESDDRYVQVGLGNSKVIHTLYKSEFDQLATRDANAIYFVKRNV